jgi:hypothetical protein
MAVGWANGGLDGGEKEKKLLTAADLLLLANPSIPRNSIHLSRPRLLRPAAPVDTVTKGRQGRRRKLAGLGRPEKWKPGREAGNE